MKCDKGGSFLVSQLRGLFFLSIFFVPTISQAAEHTSCSLGIKWLQSSCKRLEQIWTEGYNELYITGYAWHNRYAYTNDRAKKYNENAYGTGLGKGFIDEKGNWHGLYAFAFLDSHKKIEPIAGYAYLKLFNLNKDIKSGFGFSVFLTSRPDINHNIPFPGALPWISMIVNRVTVSATYVPGHKDIGNVLFLFAKYKF